LRWKTTNQKSLHQQLFISLFVTTDADEVSSTVGGLPSLVLWIVMGAAGGLLVVVITVIVTAIVCCRRRRSLIRHNKQRFLWLLPLMFESILTS